MCAMLQLLLISYITMAAQRVFGGVYFAKITDGGNET